MRRHATHDVIPPWSVGTPVLDPAALAVVRVEPVIRRRRAALAIDACLARADGTTVVPLILADPAVVLARDRDPLIFPAGTPGDDAFAAGLADRIVPLLTQLLLAGPLDGERVFTLAEAPAFAAARAAGCFGAAPLRDALARLAPYRWAWRFARGRTVLAGAPDAVGGWALLRHAATVAVAPARRDPAALRWYGDAPVAGDGPVQVAIVDGDAPPAAAYVIRVGAAAGVPAVDPLPLDVGFAFDDAEGPPASFLALDRVPAAPVAAPIPAHVAVGGSSGRIAVIVGRADAERRPGADTDEAAAAFAALRAEGFTTVAAGDVEELAGADLIHLFGVRDGRRARAVVEAGRRAGVPVAVHAYDDDAEHGGWWGAAVARHCFEYGDDDATTVQYLAMLAARQVTVDGIAAGVPYAPAEAALDEAFAALRDAAVVFAASADEAEAIRLRSGRRGPIVVVPPLAAAVAPAPVVAAVGPDPFALVHAPIGPAGNQLHAAWAAARAGVTLVVAGPVADASYLERVREFGGPRLIVLPGEPVPALAAGLRAAAAVVVDPAWLGAGGARLVAAAFAGARLVVADRRRLPAGLDAVRVDPADAEGLSRAIGEAWDASRRGRATLSAEAAAALAPSAAVRAIVRGYAAAGTPVA